MRPEAATGYEILYLEIMFLLGESQGFWKSDACGNHDFTCECFFFSSKATIAKLPGKCLQIYKLNSKPESVTFFDFTFRNKCQLCYSFGIQQA